MLVGCVGIYGERVEQALIGIKRLRPYVDRYVVIADESVTEEQKQLLRKEGCEVYFEPWQDSMVKMRNAYLKRCQHGSWIVVHDPDEIFCQEFCENVRKIVKDAEEKDLVLLLINSHDVTYNPDNSKDESVSDFFKNLIFHYVGNTYYEGVGEVKEVHETLIMPPGVKTAQLPRKYFYTHVKTLVEVWERAFRNVWLAGGGNNVGDRNLRWRPLRQITDRLGLKTWPEVRGYLRRGNIDREFLDWIRECQNHAGWDWENECFDSLKYYRAIHPEELPDIAPAMELKLKQPSLGSPPEVMHYVEETYKEVLGRHADDAGKEGYTKAILEGRLRREILPILLRQSEEYQAKFLWRSAVPLQIPQAQIPTVPLPLGPAAPSEAGETVRMPVPVNVDVRLTETLFVDALRRSKIWAQVKPRLDLGSWLEGELGAEGWRRLQEWFYGETPTLERFRKKLGELKG